MPVTIEEFWEFAARQGCDHVEVSRQVSPRTDELVRRIVFSNGAVSDGLRRHTPPPDDPRERLELYRQYLAGCLEKEVREFNGFKRRCSEQASWNALNPESCPPPPRNAPHLLRAGAERVAKLRQQLAEVMEQLEDPEQQRRANDRRQAEAESRMAAAQLAQEIEGITI